jgi:predicted DNA-binding antitoxin AbrB/MazE fold protein
MTIHAVFEHGVFRPTENVDLPEGQEVEVQVRLVETPKTTRASVSPGLAEIYAILGERYHSGHAGTAERHDERQP